MSQWKKVFEIEGCDWTHRMEIEGGHLYRNIIIIRGTEHVTMTFVPSPPQPLKIEDCVHVWDVQCVAVSNPSQRCYKCDLTVTAS